MIKSIFILPEHSEDKITNRIVNFYLIHFSEFNKNPVVTRYEKL
jgi:hypothetical protein